MYVEERVKRLRRSAIPHDPDAMVGVEWMDIRNMPSEMLECYQRSLRDSPSSFCQREWVSLLTRVGLSTLRQLKLN